MEIHNIRGHDIKRAQQHKYSLKIVIICKMTDARVYSKLSASCALWEGEIALNKQFYIKTQMFIY